MSAENKDLYQREASDRSDLYRKEQQAQRRSMTGIIPVHADDGDGRLLDGSNDFRVAGMARVALEDRQAQAYAAGRKLPTDLKDEVAKMMGEGLKHVETWASDNATPKADAAVKANIMSAVERGVVDGADAVNLPAHYARYKIEPIRFLVENFGAVILVGKVVKYTMRYDAKNGLEDIAKAARCLHMLGEYVKGNPDWWKRDS